MTPTEIAQSLFFKLPVIDSPPNAEPIEYAAVKAIRYTHNKETGGSSVGLELKGYIKNSSTVAYMRYCSLKEPCDEVPPEIKIPARIRSAFEEYKAVTVKTDNFSGEWDEITKIEIELDSKGKPVVWCIFENKYELHKAQPKDVKVKPKKECIDYQAVLDLFAELCPMLPKPSRLNDTRRTAIRSAINEGVDLSELFSKVAGSYFLTKKHRGCGFDWIMKPANRLKILEGNYDNFNNTIEKKQSSFNIAELDRIK